MPKQTENPLHNRSRPIGYKGLLCATHRHCHHLDLTTNVEDLSPSMHSDKLMVHNIWWTHCHMHTQHKHWTHTQHNRLHSTQSSTCRYLMHLRHKLQKYTTVSAISILTTSSLCGSSEKNEPCCHIIGLGLLSILFTRSDFAWVQ